MCKSVRGAAFFGSSLHLALSFVFLFWFIFDTLISEINIALWKCDPPEQKFRDIDPIAHYLNIVFKLLYFIALCVTGIYIFRGVERERPQLLKYAALAFVILQIIGVILFSVFFSIQWNTEPDADPVPHHFTDRLPETARLVSDGAGESGQAPIPRACGACPNLEEKGNADTDLNILNTVTPIVSESVLPAPELNETTTTTPIPLISNPIPQGNGAATTTTTLSPVISSSNTTTSAVEEPAPETPLAPITVPQPRRRLPHNQLVSLVFQMCLAVTNGLSSIVYVIVLALYMLKL